MNVRYENGVLEYFNGAEWVPIPNTAGMTPEEAQAFVEHIERVGSEAELGHFKVGQNLTVGPDGKLNVTVEEASTTKKGIVKLNNTATSTSTTEAATANIVKYIYDKIGSGMLNTDSKNIIGAINEILQKESGIVWLPDFEYPEYNTWSPVQYPEGISIGRFIYAGMQNEILTFKASTTGYSVTTQFILKYTHNNPAYANEVSFRSSSMFGDGSNWMPAFPISKNAEPTAWNARLFNSYNGTLKTTGLGNNLVKLEIENLVTTTAITPHGWLHIATIDQGHVPTKIQGVNASFATENVYEPILMKIDFRGEVHVKSTGGVFYNPVLTTTIVYPTV